MEDAAIGGNWIADAAIVVFLVLLVLVVARTMALFATLTFMPVARVVRRIERLFGRGKP